MNIFIFGFSTFPVLRDGIEKKKNTQKVPTSATL